MRSAFVKGTIPHCVSVPTDYVNNCLGYLSIQQYSNLLCQWSMYDGYIIHGCVCVCVCVCGFDHAMTIPPPRHRCVMHGVRYSMYVVCEP